MAVYLSKMAATMVGPGIQMTSLFVGLMLQAALQGGASGGGEFILYCAEEQI